MIHAVIQRVKQASVQVEQQIVGKIQTGLCLLVGFSSTTEPPLDRFIEKVLHLRIFPDAQEKMNLSLLDYGGELLLVSQFTLAGSIVKGRRPSFDSAMPPELAQTYFEELVRRFKSHLKCVETGQFGASMEVSLVNWGPVTFHLEIK